MDKDEGIRALSRCFEDKWFLIADIPKEKIHEIASLFGVNVDKPRGIRSQLGFRLTVLKGYQCEGLKLVVCQIPKEKDPSPNRYRIQALDRAAG